MKCSASLKESDCGTNLAKIMKDISLGPVQESCPVDLEAEFVIIPSVTGSLPSLDMNGSVLESCSRLLKVNLTDGLQNVDVTNRTQLYIFVFRTVCRQVVVYMP